MACTPSPLRNVGNAIHFYAHPCNYHFYAHAPHARRPMSLAGYTPSFPGTYGSSSMDEFVRFPLLLPSIGLQPILHVDSRRSVVINGACTQ